MKKQFTTFLIIFLIAIIFSPLSVFASEYNDLYCPKIIKVEDSLGNVGINGVQGSFIKGAINTITVKITATDPQGLPLHYQFLFNYWMKTDGTEMTNWVTENSAILDVSNTSPGANQSNWIRVDNQDGYGCIGAYYDTQANFMYDVYPPETNCLSFTYSDWSACQSNGTQTRTVISSSPNGCSGGSPVLTQFCTYTPPTCTSWTYSDWSACTNNQQTRTITSSQPANCAGGNPILSQSCNSTPLCTENNWTSTLTPISCPNNGQQTKKWTKVGECQGGISRPSEETVSCNYQVPACTNFTYSDWSACGSSGVQSRTTLSASPSGCTGGSPVLNRSCNYIAPCSSDIWSCGDWGNCSADGSQTRICTKTFDCPDVQTESPITNQHCEISNQNSQNEPQANQIQNEPTPIKNNEQEVSQEKNITGSQVAEQRRSEVASAVQGILQVAERDSGVGQQVKIIAQTQAQNQEKLEISLQKAQNRSGLVKFFVGPNYKEINNAQKLLERNREQIKQLNQVKNQLVNQDDQQKLTEQIQLFEQSNQEIDNSLNTSQKGFSLFGWLFRLFVK